MGSLSQVQSPSFSFQVASISTGIFIPSMTVCFRTVIIQSYPLCIRLSNVFSVFLGLIQTPDVNIIKAVLSIPVSIVIGILSGIILGYILLFFFRKRYTTIRATEKTLIILVFGSLLVQVGDLLHFAALLGLMTLGFILLEKHEKIAHEVSEKLSKLWIPAEIILFVLIGFSLDISTAFEAGLKGIFIITLGLLFRSLGVIIACSFSGLSVKERIFCVIAYLPKATVQAAPGSVALSHSIPGGETILALTVIAILFTSPLGLTGIRTFSKRLLQYQISD